METKYAGLTDEPTLTPAQALFDLVRTAGFAKNKAGFAKLLKVRPENIYHYLANSDVHHRISLSPGKLQEWCWALRRATENKMWVAQILYPDATLELEIHGSDAEGNPIEGLRYRTIFDSIDFSPPKGWEEDWQQEIHAYPTEETEEGA